MSGLKPQALPSGRSALAPHLLIEYRVTPHRHTHPGIATHPDADPARRA